MIVIAINVFVPWEYPTLKLGAGFVFLIVFLWLSIKSKPYKNPLHLRLEIRELICSITTLYTAVYFNQSTTVIWTLPLVILFIALTHMHFFTLLIFLYMWIPNFHKMRPSIWKYESVYLQYVKFFRFISFIGSKTPIWLHDDKYGTSREEDSLSSMNKMTIKINL